MDYTKKGYRIGLVIGNVEDDFSNQVCKGVMRGAEILGDTVFVFPVKYFGQDESDSVDMLQRYEYQYNNMLTYAQSHSLDMILFCLSTIAYRSTPEEYNYLLHIFKDIPVLLIATKSDEFPSVVYDNESGLREGINYIIKQKKCRHIAMLTGIASNTDAQERYQVFCDVMAENNISVPETMIVRGEFNDKCYPLVEKLLKENPELQAIVCANDSMAKAVYSVLNQYHFSIGKDILVMGFDDIADAASMVPPLATVRADAALLGYRGIMEGHSLLEKYLEDPSKPLPPNNYIVNTTFINRESLTGVKQKEKKITEEMLIEQKETIKRMLHMNHMMNICTRDMLMYNQENIGDYATVLNGLNIQEIDEVYIFTLPKPVACYSNKDMIHSSSLYLKAYRKGKDIIVPPAQEQHIEIDRLFEHPCFNNGQKTYFVLDIYSREWQYGILVCTLPHHLVHYTESICFHMSMAAKVMDLFHIQDGLLKDREDMVRKLEAENTLLDDISKKDELTGVCNRLGFMSKANDMLRDHVGQRAIVLYADLNYLKRINDTYSHAEGNFALITCGQALEKVMGDHAVVGRIGGDEFAAFAILQNRTGSEISHRIKQMLKNINDESHKPYKVSLSIGHHEFIIRADSTLKEVISLADEQLYKDKNMKPPFEG
ncbi:MAG: GGDEF domain-containing protein [Lachnospiraceae bacterium]|nr:GGDEF domain-containing protein [Lachnospiraceae bacterium]